VRCPDRFAEWLAKQFQQQHAGKDLRTSPAAMLSLLHAVESAKCALSSQESVTIRVPGVLDGGNEWAQEVTRAQFNELITPKLRVTLEAVDKALRDGKVTKQQVDQIVLAGGSTRQSRAGEAARAHVGD
jgi:molecular chaperone DnaK (HSP70)